MILCSPLHSAGTLCSACHGIVFACSHNHSWARSGCSPANLADKETRAFASAPIFGACRLLSAIVPVVSSVPVSVSKIAKAALQGAKRGRGMAQGCATRAVLTFVHAPCASQPPQQRPPQQRHPWQAPCACGQLQPLLRPAAAGHETTCCPARLLPLLLLLRMLLQRQMAWPAPFGCCGAARPCLAAPPLPLPPPLQRRPPLAPQQPWHACRGAWQDPAPQQLLPLLPPSPPAAPPARSPPPQLCQQPSSSCRRRSPSCPPLPSRLPPPCPPLLWLPCSAGKRDGHRGTTHGNTQSGKSIVRWARAPPFGSEARAERHIRELPACEPASPSAPRGQPRMCGRPLLCAQWPGRWAFGSSGRCPCPTCQTVAHGRAVVWEGSGLGGQQGQDAWRAACGLLRIALAHRTQGACCQNPAFPCNRRLAPARPKKRKAPLPWRTCSGRASHEGSGRRPPPHPLPGGTRLGWRRARRPPGQGAGREAARGGGQTCWESAIMDSGCTAESRLHLPARMHACGSIAGPSLLKSSCHAGCARLPQAQAHLLSRDAVRRLLGVHPRLRMVGQRRQGFSSHVLAMSMFRHQAAVGARPCQRCSERLHGSAI